jgi:tRNA-dihydrouridine synthase B
MKPFSIGTAQVTTPIVFAPLAGISNLPMRVLAKEAGAGLVCSEMISSHGLVYGSAKTHELLAAAPQERPLSIQIFGHDPHIVAEGARIAVHQGADIIDINFGCAVKKILKSGSGAALMADLPKARRLIERVRAAVSVPLTIKIRSGWDASGEDAVDLARIAEDCGVDAITVHPRTARQGFSGRADWSLIARLKSFLAIPVVGNGDISSADDALAMFTQTGCDAVMVGRAAIGNPFIFSRIHHRLCGRAESSPSPGQRLDAMRRYLDRSIDLMGELRACRMMRSRLVWFVKGLPQAGIFRKKATRIESRSHALELINAYEKLLAQQTGIRP